VHEPAGAPKAREGVDRGFDESSLSEKTRDAAEDAGVSPRRRAGVEPLRP